MGKSQVKDIQTMEKLCFLIKNNSIDNLIMDIKKEYKENESIYYDAYVKLRFKELENQKKFIKAFIYKNLKNTKCILKLWHRFRDVKNPCNFYTEKPFMSDLEFLLCPGFMLIALKEKN